MVVVLHDSHNARVVRTPLRSHSQLQISPLQTTKIDASVSLVSKQMPFDLVWEAKGVTKVFTGHLSFNDIMRSSRMVEGDERFDSIRFVINDLLRVEGIDVNQNEVDEIAAVDAAASTSNKKIRLAAVVTDASIVALVKAYAESPYNTYPFKIFSTIDEARAWLGV